MTGWEQYGIVGLVIAGLGAYIVKIEDRHRKERKEWRESEEQKFKEVKEINKETNTVLRENTNILSGLKTLLENRRTNGR